MDNQPSATNPATRSLARFVRWNVLGTGTSLVIGFLASVLLARLLGPADRGLLAVMIAAGTLALVVSAGGLPVSVVYFASRREREGPAILGNCLLHAAVLTAILVPGVLLFYHPVASLFSHGRGGRTWVLAAALVPITFLAWTTASQLQGMLEFGRLNVLLVLQRVAYALAILILLGVLSLGVSAGLIAAAIGSAVTIAGSVILILRLGPPRLDFALMTEMLTYGVKAQVGSILEIANGRLDVIILGFYRPPSQVGYYVVAQAIAEIVVQLATAFQWSNMALISRDQGADPEASTSAVALRHLTLITGLATLFNAAFGTLVILLGYGKAFHPAVVPMLILLPGVWFLSLSVVIQGDLGGRGRPGLASILVAVAAGVTVILDIALIPPFGVYGAAIASVVAYSTLGISSLLTLRRVSRIPLRELLLPTRADVAVYVKFARRFLAGLRSRTGTSR
jgi:O-antigen/teichoic acid export membrane protein